MAGSDTRTVLALRGSARPAEHLRVEEFIDKPVLTVSAETTKTISLSAWPELTRLNQTMEPRSGRFLQLIAAGLKLGSASQMRRPLQNGAAAPLATALQLLRRSNLQGVSLSGQRVVYSGCGD